MGLIRIFDDTLEDAVINQFGVGDKEKSRVSNQTKNLRLCTICSQEHDHPNDVVIEKSNEQGFVHGSSPLEFYHNGGYWVYRYNNGTITEEVYSDDDGSKGEVITFQALKERDFQRNNKVAEIIFERFEIERQREWDEENSI